MPRSFDMATEYPATVERVHQAFRSEQYWRARLANFGADDATLDKLTVSDDGHVDVITSHVLRADGLPALVSQFHHGDLRIRREEHWQPVRDGRSAVTVSGFIAGAPVTLDGGGVLALAGGGARLTVTLSVEVRVPLVGGKIENFIGGQLVDLLTAEQRFTTVWITENS
ncbi:hypothetical protein A5784_34500 [Mycobacterium sp. 852013-50091_SCH5140682]|uniref:DUF2505 domain-containing protein n=1 Tax=Mycobacterium sp. 852013-50091_SCH5140682 TaxID=1834109 RepID=UPI0007E98E6D|nr:DUF2505 domain-containing protein [Mycobacterium sp. 852013-50091_SCH5140682]OBC11621.1 hypothetical protein A5784_34500 [Mycobacterium sp. 852013-50091_SCH5140682]